MTQAIEDYKSVIEIEELVSSAQEVLRVNRQWLPFLQKSSLDTFSEIWQSREGEVVKERPGLEIRRIELTDPHEPSKNEVLFIKKHEQKRIKAEQSEGLKEFSNYCAFRRRGLSTAVPIAAGMAQGADGQIHSFLVTRDFSPFVDLEELVLNQPESLQGPGNGARKKKMLRAVARYARTMHDAGCNQKDFNATHVLLAGLDEEHPQVALFDLQRVDTSPLTRFRWPIKAMAEFFFTLPSDLFDEEDRRFFFTAYKGTGKASLYSRLQYGWILSKMARIARHTKKRNLAPKMKE